MPRLPIALLALPLVACEGSLSLDVTGVPPAEVNAAVIQVSAIRFDRASGSTSPVRFDPPLEIDLLTLDRGQTLRLLDGEELASGRYQAIELVIEAQSQVLDSRIEESDGGEISLVLAAGASSRAALDFEIEEDDNTALVLEFDLRSSLLPGRTAAEDQALSPRLRLVAASASASLSGDIDAAVFDDEACDDDNSGRVVYLFDDQQNAADDLDGLAPEPLTTALVTPSDTRADYVIAQLAAGDYRLALTCQAQLDDPDLDDAIAFLQTRDVSLSRGSAQTVNFTTDTSKAQ